MVLLTASIYILIPNNVRIDVGKTYSTFKVWENEWVLAGQEYTLMFDGTTKMRASSRKVEQFIDGEIVKIIRTANFKDNVTVIDTYTFDGNEKDIELFPISHDINVVNGEGYILVYEVTKLEYSGETVKNILSPQEFGHNMKVSWEVGNYYSRIWSYTDKNEGKLTIKYRPSSANYTKQVKLFDPLWNGTASEGLLAWYTFNNTYNDSLGETNLSLVGLVTFDEGKIGEASVFVGNKNNYLYNISTAVIPTQVNGTIEAWVKINDTTSLKGIWGTSTTASYQPNHLTIRGTNLTLNIAKQPNHGDILHFAGSLNINTSDYVHVAGTWNNTNMSLWINGICVNSTSKAISSSPGTLDGFCIGVLCTELPATQFPFNGTIDELMIWNFERNASEIISDMRIKPSVECNPTLNSDWVISDAQICDAKDVTTGTGQINITSLGNLTLINSANVTTFKLNIEGTGNKVFINSGCEIRT